MYEHITVAVGGAFFGEGSGPIFLDNVDCTGTESNLTQCSHGGIGIHNCDHGDDAGVICAGNHMDIHIITRTVVHTTTSIKNRLSVDNVQPILLLYGTSAIIIILQRERHQLLSIKY